MKTIQDTYYVVELTNKKNPVKHLTHELAPYVTESQARHCALRYHAKLEEAYGPDTWDVTLHQTMHPVEIKL